MLVENILNYIYWRKDITFNERKFNEVDALILAELCYVEWDNIVKDKPVTLANACKKYYELHSDEDMAKKYAFSSKIPEFIKALQNTVRFKNIKLKNYTSVFDTDKEIQFAAITYVLPDGSLYVAYRGTDSSMLGWKEDMKMTYQDEIPSHQLAFEYLDKVFDDLEPVTSLFGFRSKMVYPKLYLGGHSKGGNLSMYAGIASKKIQPHITKIFNFDGPGFRDSFYETHDITPILSRIITYLPTSSIIGRLLTHKEEHIIIDAYENGLAQHDSFCWKVGFDGFQLSDKLSKESDETHAYIIDILLSKSDEHKQSFIELVFTIFNKLDIKSISDLSELGLKQGVYGLKELSAMSIEERKFFLDVMRFLWMQTKTILFVKK